MEAPQIIFLALIAIGLLLAANQHGEERPPTSFWSNLISASIAVGLTWWGGFFN